MKPYLGLICLIVLSAVFSETGFQSAAITVIPNAVVALINDSTYFNCSTASEKVEWLFSSDKDLRQSVIYSYGKVKALYQERFRVEKYANTTGKQFNLVLQSVVRDDIGRYICRDPDRNEEGEAQLIVLETEPFCESNLNADGLIIGDNNGSFTIKPETAVQLSCSVRYSGNQVPELQWTKTGENIAINSSICSDSGNVYICNLTMESELQMDGSSYVCQTTQSMTKQYNCTSGVFRIISLDALGEHKDQITGDGNKPIIIVGIIVGLLIGVLVAVIGIVILWKKRKQSQQKTPEEESLVLRAVTPKFKKNRDKRVRGLTILNDKLFVAFEKSSIIEVFPVNSDMSSHKSLVVKDLLDPGTIASCAKNSCLYIIDQIDSSDRKIFSVKPDGKVINVWETDEDRGRISVNRDGNIVMTVHNKNKLKIYSPDGTLLREKTIGQDFSGTPITDIFHAINLSDGNFIISRGIYKSDIHQVCKVDATGKVLQSFGDKKGSGDAELDCPAFVAERNDGSILVADRGNHRIIRLNSDLKFEEELFAKEKHNVSRPGFMFVYEKTDPALLFLGCNKTLIAGGYVLVLKLDQ